MFQVLLVLRFMSADMQSQMQNNYSFSGECGPLSKLVIMIIMLRGRHRQFQHSFLITLQSLHLAHCHPGGLPLALDRSSRGLLILPKARTHPLLFDHSHASHRVQGFTIMCAAG
jgi:hypothetical protein